MKRYLILLAFLWFVMARPAAAQELTGSGEGSETGQTSVTAFVEEGVSSDEEEKVQTGDSNTNLVYLALFFVSGSVILADVAGKYKEN